ncbi:Pre-mRNA-splicing factor CWC24 [Nakaseomyces bracarensis]|uniref:Pre-mRNA-splicing factor CWC24 n=1 Tax=Nakaseomyces bracarensis TaxID=273131 RepID=A0ABR4NVB6_9SACH
MFKKRNTQGTTRRRKVVKGGSSGLVEKKHTKKPALPLDNTKVVESIAKVHVVKTDDNANEELSHQLKHQQEKVNDDQERLERLRQSATKEDRLNAEGKDSEKKIRQAGNLRNTLLMDFQPDVCKDFKQTGYCGYGDSCKFLHSRDDFKAGWDLNKDWKVDENNKPEDTNADIPFKCAICKQDYQTPVKTNCNHYFCRKCFVDRNRTEKTCFICGTETGGIAKIATNICGTETGGIAKIATNINDGK